MRLTIDATPDELADKGEQLVKALAAELATVAPDLAEALEKAIPKSPVKMLQPGLRGIHDITRKAYAERLAWMVKDIGEVLDRAVLAKGDELAKASHHKYIRRVPKPGGGYRYYYDVTGGHGLGSPGEFRVGTKFALPDGGKKGHFEILDVAGEKVRVKHDETGKEIVVTQYDLAHALYGKHQAAVEREATQMDTGKDMLDDYPKDGPIKRGMNSVQAANAIRGQPVEHFVVFGSNGQQLYRMRGSVYELSVPYQASLRMEQDGNAVFVHNHVVDLPISNRDIQLAVYVNLGEIQAHTPGATWVLKRPDKGWGVKDEDRASFDKDIDNIFDSADRSALIRALREKGNKEVLNAHITEESVKACNAFGRKYGWVIERRSLDGGSDIG